jgi:diguanylate cyclase (GGDEF)-like protein
MYVCPRCGRFEADSAAVHAYRNRASQGWEENRYLLSGRARNATEEGRKERFHMKDFSAVEHSESPEPDVYEKIRRMLRWFERKSTRNGDWIKPVSAIDYPVACCRDEHEWTYLLVEVATRKGWLKRDDVTAQRFLLTIDGRDKLQERPPVEVAERGDYWSTYPEADLDALTKLPLRGRFITDLERSFAEATETSPVALLFIDIDHFKKVNDEHGGHAAGDRVLSGVAEIFRSAVGRRGLVYRCGGEEITVILPGFSEAEAAAVAERLRESVERVDWRLAPSRSVTVSIGVAALPDGKITSSALWYQHADQAMYSAKKNGRNRVALASGVD